MIWPKVGLWRRGVRTVKQYAVRRVVNKAGFSSVTATYLMMQRDELLRSLCWHRLQLILNHHYPVGLVSFQRSAHEQLAFLHGECGRSGCLEKVHLYQLSLVQNCIKVSGNMKCYTKIHLTKST